MIGWTKFIMSNYPRDENIHTKLRVLKYQRIRKSLAISLKLPHHLFHFLPLSLGTNVRVFFSGDIIKKITIGVGSKFLILRRMP